MAVGCVENEDTQNRRARSVVPTSGTIISFPSQSCIRDTTAMTESSDSNYKNSIATVESLPAGGLSMSQIDALSGSDAAEVAAPLVIDTTSSSVTHFDLVFDDTHHCLGWNPTDNQWEQILVVVDNEDELVLESAATVYEADSKEVKIGLEQSRNPELKDIAEFIWRYVEYTYLETDDLHNVMDEALEELSVDEE
ncbi:hypothetical protein BDK88_2073 [Natrinema hispanicum]|uniref:DUF7964 domain-containing protein n=2 Tax=Natrinema hispanicum TaxID=392421 RepID=A0A482YD83_9EURY|nr:hypothetical protein BDK88_2073 [Natrinema hispanicum]